jgi:cation:H+ antiporter
VTAAVLLLAGGVLLIVGAELLVLGASRLASSLGITPVVIGLTVVAFGTSAPELAVTLDAAWQGQADLGLGNIVGSNIFNILFILGLSALVAPLTVADRLVRLDVPLMIGASLLAAGLSLDGRVGRLDGALLFACIVAYTGFMLRRARAKPAAGAERAGAAGRKGAAVARATQAAFILGGLGMLAFGARWVVGGAVEVAQALGVSQLVIGLTSLRGERDIAVGNVVGSNIFNLLAVLGAGSLAAPGGIPVPSGALTFDIPVMIGTAVVTLPIFFTGYCIARWEGALLLGFYAAYVWHLVLVAAEHPLLPEFELAMLYFALPMTAVTLGVLGARAWFSRPRGG